LYTGRAKHAKKIFFVKLKMRLEFEKSGHEDTKTQFFSTADGHE